MVVTVLNDYRNVFLDVLTRYPAAFLDLLKDKGLSDSYLNSQGLFSKKWLSEFSDSNLEAYYAYRDKFLDNKDSTRTAITPFSDAQITKVAQSLSMDQKRINLSTCWLYAKCKCRC